MFWGSSNCGRRLATIANSPNAVNYDEGKADKYPGTLPDPLKLKNGKRVTTAKMWWKERRPEIEADFDSEVVGRVPAHVPSVKWEVTDTRTEMLGGVAVVKKTLKGHVDNSRCIPRSRTRI